MSAVYVWYTAYTADSHTGKYTAPPYLHLALGHRWPWDQAGGARVGRGTVALRYLGCLPTITSSISEVKDAQSQRQKRKTSDQPIEGKNEWKLKALCEVQIPRNEILMARKKYLQTLDPNQNSEGQQPIDAEQDEIKELPIQPDKIQLIEISDDENEKAPVEFSARRWSSTLCQQCGTDVRCNI